MEEYTSKPVSTACRFFSQLMVNVLDCQRIVLTWISLGFIINNCLLYILTLYTCKSCRRILKWKGSVLCGGCIPQWHLPCIVVPSVKTYSRPFSIIHVSLLFTSLLLFSNRSGNFERLCLTFLFLMKPLNIIVLGIHAIKIHTWPILIIYLNSLTFLVPTHCECRGRLKYQTINHNVSKLIFIVYYIIQNLY